MNTTTMTLRMEKNQMPLVGLLTLAVALLGCRVGTENLKKASAGFVPRLVYGTTFDKAWQALNQALDANQIPVASSEKAEGRLKTDYRRGASLIMAPGATADSRYNYNVKVTSEDGGKVRISIITTVEVSVSASGGNWKDATRENQADAKNLTDWLYEQVEKAL